MSFLSRISDVLANGHLAANLIAVHGLITLEVLVALILRRLLQHGHKHVARIAGQRWVGTVSATAARHVRFLILWIALLAVATTLVAGVVYHLAGQDARADLDRWYAQLTVEELVQFGLRLGALIGLAAGAWLAARMVRRYRRLLEAHSKARLGRPGHEEAVHRWFAVLERFLIGAIYLSALWAAGRIVGFGPWADEVVGFLLRVATIVVISRLLTLGSRTLSRTVADLGDRHLGKGKFRHYWERLTRLFPFGQRCFEAAVYVTAASLCVRELHFVNGIADFGPRIVHCIGIFFGTRVLIELLHVLLAEAFGLYREDRPIDQKGRTLVPLLQSVSQYALYFGSALMMLGVLGVDTRPILAGSAILGLAVGLGAQNLVTDVVSGFFILFENQYLVGDVVKIADAAGTVEEVGIRVTHIRDEHGKLHIIPNGQIKGVISFSKGYVNAVVDVRLPSGRHLEDVFRAMAEAGRRLRESCRDVLAETEVKGLVEFGTSEMTVRAVTKVRPGTHGAVQNEYRRLLKEVLDEEQRGMSTLKAA
jgi:small conductance mechanosensitive channel